MDHDKALRQISVTALFYLEDSRKIHLRSMRARRSKDVRRRAPQRAGKRERELALAPLFICLSLPGPVLCKLGQAGVLFVLPEVLTPVLWPSFVLFSRASLSFSHHRFGLLFPILLTFFIISISQMIFFTCWDTILLVSSVSLPMVFFSSFIIYGTGDSKIFAF